MDTIKHKEYTNLSEAEKIKIDSLLTGNVSEEEIKYFLIEDSTYLWRLNYLKYYYIRENGIEYAPTFQNQLLELASKEAPSKKSICRIINKEQGSSDLIYNPIIREMLIKTGFLEKYTPSVDTLNAYASNLKSYTESNDILNVYKTLMILSLNDFKSFNENEKAVILQTLDLNTEILLSAWGYIFEETKIHYGTWEDFWLKKSNYAFISKPEDNSILCVKHFCINSDYEDERIDMSFFPHLPTIYDENDLTDSKTFLNNIDWSQDFYDYELDFILATNMDNYDKEQYGQIIEKIKTRIGG